MNERIRVATNEGDRMVEVSRRVGVWALTQSPFFESLWHVTHVPSGLSAFRGTRQRAASVLDALGKSLPKWSLEGGDVQQVTRVVERASVKQRKE